MGSGFDREGSCSISHWPIRRFLAAEASSRRSQISRQIFFISFRYVAEALRAGRGRYRRWAVNTSRLGLRRCPVRKPEMLGSADTFAPTHSWLVMPGIPRRSGSSVSLPRQTPSSERSPSSAALSNPHYVLYKDIIVLQDPSLPISFVTALIPQTFQPSSLGRWSGQRCHPTTLIRSAPISRRLREVHEVLPRSLCRLRLRFCACRSRTPPESPHAVMHLLLQVTLPQTTLAATCRGPA